ncbi:MAG: NAD(P)-binding domain-containing protein [Saprospiraceae bacterium]|nr:NAD(P)-binding domain-containing protein [Saprospiraceae bacterium]
MTVINVIIVGSGPAGIGIATLLHQTNIDYAILEKKEIGNSFSEWPENMEMITPSFPSNAFGQMDLNSICEATSPAFSFKKEHLTGKEYAQYLSWVANYFEINVRSNTEVKKVYKKEGGWIIETSQDLFFCRYLIWAAGEFLNPQINNILGAEHCLHSSQIKYPSKVKDGEFVVIGGYESGVQMAYDLIKGNKNVTLVNPFKVDDMETSDPSRILSPYTYSKYSQMKKSEQYTEVLGEVVAVTNDNDRFQVLLQDGATIETDNIPICATGFSLVSEPIEEFILYREDGSPILNEETDEFIDQQNIYLSGPSVRHDNHIFCFIYKFRQRFGVIVEDILKKEECSEEDLSYLVNKWKRAGLYLSDLSCCGDECVC